MKKITSPLKAIRAKCLDCSNDSPQEVRSCNITGCSLHDFRMGKNPHRKSRELSPAQIKEMSERLSRARKSKSIKD